MELTWGSNKLHFTYDSTGPLSVNCNGTEYFYVKNAQDDVTGLVNASGTRVVTYTYDAWGNLLLVLISFKRVVVMCSCPETSAKVFGRHFL